LDLCPNPDTLVRELNCSSKFSCRKIHCLWHCEGLRYQGNLRADILASTVDFPQSRSFILGKSYAETNHSLFMIRGKASNCIVLTFCQKDVLCLNVRMDPHRSAFDNISMVILTIQSHGSGQSDKHAHSQNAWRIPYWGRKLGTSTNDTLLFIGYVPSFVSRRLKTDAICEVAKGLQPTFTVCPILHDVDSGTNIYASPQYTLRAPLQNNANFYNVRACT